MPKILLFGLVTTVVAALPAFAENWIIVASDNQGTSYYIDPESVQEQGNSSTYLFWWMSVRAKPDENGVVAEKTLVSMSCPLRGWRRKAVARFNDRGELISREEFAEAEPLLFFANGTVGERLWKFVCK